MWRSNNNDKPDNRNKHFPTYIAPHFPGIVQFLKCITLKPFVTPREWDAEQVLFTISGDGSLGHWYLKASHYSSHRHNNEDKISEEENLEASSGEESRGHRSLETIHSSSSNCGVLERRSFDTSQFSSCNSGGYVVRGGSRSQDTSQYYSCNWITTVYVEGRDEYRSHTSHYSSHNQGDSGRLLTLPLSSYRVEEKDYVNRRVVSELRMVDLDIGSKILDNFSLKM